MGVEDYRHLTGIHSKEGYVSTKGLKCKNEGENIAANFDYLSQGTG